ncbi:PREDICTED: A disintegrin and metalloproteinase with thrombospondin motifs 18-like [Acropora digitifera]|uniref:A disintegrin and metalloproteinase with thrombospondin motifs 18-like n=1 Tax=Acropora digitifera TaxID=70779 RepID=UPI00077ABCBD|nr:PREDICTED: A disintegrin and metalloproteinase with thrombospondin motifs 18-like [Acropora digitifera]
MMDNAAWIYLLVIFYALQLSVQVTGLPSKNLHHLMTKREIEHYFGVDDHDKVPEYDITHPYQSNEQGDLLSFSMQSHTRNKRDVEPSESAFYKMDAFGSTLHLKLKRNDNLLAPGMTVIRRNRDGTTTAHPAPANTFYHGQVISDPKSIIAVSNHKGLTGMVKTSRDTLFVHPLPAHLAKHLPSNGDATPHLIHRRSSNKNRAGYNRETTKDGKITNLKRTGELHYQDAKKHNNESDGPKYKTLKAGYLYAQPLADKHNQQHLSVLGGVENFLALVANIVAGLFQDHSVGKIKITYVLTNISLIDPAEYGFNESTSSIAYKKNKILGKVNQQTVNYDVFSYVSNQNSNGGGVANLNEMCRRITGNVNSDVGIQTALHIAHETAHNMNVHHDSGDCGKEYIMFYRLPVGAHATEWTACSRHALQAFLADEKRSACLDDGISENDTVLDSPFRNSLPGLAIDGDKQCELQIGAGFKRVEREQCTFLKCSNAFGVTMYNGVGPMDGTSCIPGKWCMKGICQSTGVVLTLNNGYWSDWKSEYTPCTRSCGGGVQYISRHCTHPNPKYCPGESRIYRICNPQVSLLSELFSSQKAQFRTIHRVGCDNILDSTVTFDRCGVCGGNGSTCSSPNEFEFDGVPDDYGKKIPYIKEEDINSKVKYKYISPTQFKWETGRWSGCSLSCASGIKTRSRRCVRQDFVNDKIINTTSNDEACPAPMPNKTEPCNTQPCKAMWKFTEWSVCTKTCGMGQQYRSLQCLEEVTKGNFRQTYKCSVFTQPIGPTERLCNEYPCPMHWNTGNWSKCSTVCADGQRKRIISCRRINERGELNTIDDALCRHLIRPASEEACNGSQSCGPPVTACTRKPCLNGGSCYENGNKTKYICNCSAGFKGEKCQVPPYFGIACFKHNTGQGIRMLQDLRKDFDPSNTEPTIIKCADLSNERGYRFFALGSNGICYSGPLAEGHYYKLGTTKKQHCVNGVGRKRKAYAYSFGVAAVLSNACSRKDIVNVQGDSGLQTAYLIAHETGHKSNSSWCLDDPPSPTRPTPSPSTKLPGQMIDADQQCSHQYGTGYRRCVQFKGSCDILYCTKDGYKCESRFLRPLQGTACGKRTWCIRGSCVDNGLPKIHGGWSEWSHFTECYPPCEGGLRYRQRSCTNPPHLKVPILIEGKFVFRADDFVYRFDCVRPQNGGDECAGDTRGLWEICKRNLPILAACLVDRDIPTASTATSMTEFAAIIWMLLFMMSAWRGNVSWLSEWEMCSKSCGNGSQSKSIVCRAKMNDTHFKYDETGASCISKTRPAAEFRHCNDIKCPSQWTITWSECSQVCFPGERISTVRCSRINERGEIEQVADIQCDNKQKPAVLTEPCNEERTSDNCKEYQIGCFRSPAGLFSETLGDFTHENNPINAVMQCKELARRKNYRVFALGHGGVCMSGADAKDSYYLHQPPHRKTWCSNGIGIGDTSAVYSFDPPPKLQAVGCYKDKINDRTMPTIYANFRPYINWNNLNATLQQCAFVARDIGYEYFGVQHYGECWSSDNAALTYAKHGLQMDARQCWSNVGGVNTNFVYRIV